ncbi:unnamed protein product [Clonostachys rhizophaga]|uniref:Integrase catalytic domain-containing protein n=1 Tax=Clonostachys rhizophaga TaxID=160324 RepID=A0A9N9UWZ4_9HYPO|nr:unnamed protein product [Clonostachys rhizophaga]
MLAGNVAEEVDDDLYDRLDGLGRGDMPSLTSDTWPGPVVTEEPSFPFPTARRILRRPVDWTTSWEAVKTWFDDCGAIIGPLVPPDMIPEIVRTLWTYRDLSAASVVDVPPTDIYSHIPRLKEDQWSFISEHLLPRLLWSLLKLSFKKVAIGVKSVLAVGWVHETGGVMKIKTERSQKLRNWPTPRTQTDVRSFLGALGPCRRWIPNCAEIARPLNRLTGDVEWQWTAPEAASLALLKKIAADAMDMFGYAFDLPVDMYTDASGYGAGCAVLQTRDNHAWPILYDSFLFNKTQRNYGTYKRELLAIVEFCRKHTHLFTLRGMSTIWTDHKPLTWFLSASNHEGIYARWVTELRLLNVQIKYIEGKRNAAADGLSRTIFPGDMCSDAVEDLQTCGHMEGGEWIWKDGLDGYKNLLELLARQPDATLPPQMTKALGCHVDSFMPSWDQICWSDKTSLGDDWTRLVGGDPIWVRINASTMSDRHEEMADFAASSWYSDVTKYLLSGEMMDQYDRHELRRIRAKAQSYRIKDERLWKNIRGKWLRCLLDDEIAQALYDAHDEMGHFHPEITRRHLVRTVWWPGMTTDVVDYYNGCLVCARHASAKTKAPDQPLRVDAPFQLLGCDHIGPFPVTLRHHKYILVIVDYFSRYTWLIPCKSVSADDSVAALEQWFCWVPELPMVIYLDPESGFRSAKFVNAARRRHVEVVHSPSTSHKSTGMAEVTVKISQQILGKIAGGLLAWDDNLAAVMSSINKRHIRSLGFSPSEILYGLGPRSGLDLKYASLSTIDRRSYIRLGRHRMDRDSFQAELVLRHLSQLHDIQQNIKNQRYDTAAVRQAAHDARQSRPLDVDDLVMLLQEGKPPKLRPRWRGPFRISRRTSRALY